MKEKFNQKNQFMKTLFNLDHTYGRLVDKRYNEIEEMERYDYMLYDFYDMIIHLENFTRAYYTKSHPDYLLKKIEKVKSYVDNMYEVVKGMSEDDKDTN